VKVYTVDAPRLFADGSHALTLTHVATCRLPSGCVTTTTGVLGTVLCAALRHVAMLADCAREPAKPAADRTPRTTVPREAAFLR